MYEILVGEIVVLVLGIFAFVSLNKLILNNKLLHAEQKLRSRMANFESRYGDMQANPTELVSDGLGGMGIQGLLQALDVGNITPAMLKELGLPSWLLPVAQGFLSKMKNKGVDSGTQEKKHISQTDV